MTNEEASGNYNYAHYLPASHGHFDEKSQVTYMYEKTDNSEPARQENGITTYNGSEPARQENSITNYNGVVKTDEIRKEFKVSKLPNRSKLTLLLLIMANACAGCSFSILAPFYPQEAEKKGMSESITGFVFSSFQLISFVAALIYGNFMVHFGPKFLFVSGIIVAGVCSALFGLLDRCPAGLSFIILSFACRWFEALSVSAYVTSGFAIVCSEFPRNVATVFGITEAGLAIGLMAGPAIGGVLNEAGGFGLPFFVIGALIMLIGLVICILFPPLGGIPQKKTGNILSFLKSSLVWEGLQSVLVSLIGITFLDPVFSTHLEQFHLSPSLIGLMFVITPGLYGLTTSFWGRLVDTKDVKEILIVAGSIFSGIACLFIGPSPILPFLPMQLWVTITGMVIFGLSFGCLFVAPMKCLITGASDLGFGNNIEAFALVSGLFNATIHLGSFIGPSVSGVLVQAVGFRWAITIIGFLYFFSSLCSFIYFLVRHLIKKRKQNSLPEQCEKTELISSAVRHSVTESGEVAYQ